MDEVPSDEILGRLAAENHLLRGRTDVVADHAHNHAVRAVELQRRIDSLSGADSATLAVQRELDRLRALPEVRVGQRLRHLARSIIRRRPAAPVAPAEVAGVARVADVAGPPPVVIIVRDRLNCLEQLVTWLEANGVTEIHLVDNDSSYPPLQGYLARSPHRVWRLGANLGHEAPWVIGLIAELSASGPFVVTDPDVVPDEICPADVFGHLRGLLDRYPDVDKVGLGLRIDDLPLHARHREEVIAWERQYWTDEVEAGVFRASVDTTFALYRAAPTHHITRSLRTGPPYVARHLPWYLDSDHLPAEEAYYRDHADPSVSSWDGDGIPHWITARLASDVSDALVPDSN